MPGKTPGGGPLIRTPVFPIALMLLAAPLALADPGLPASGGLTTACGTSDNENPCRMARIIRDTLIANGSTRTYRGDYLAVGTVVVAADSTAIFDGAHVTFTSTSRGVVVEPGGTVRVLESVFDEDASSGSPYRVVAEPGGRLVFEGSTLHSGDGMVVRTDDARVASAVFTGIGVALRLENVVLTVEGNRFVDNVVAVNQTGGEPTLRSNRFEGGEYCVRNWLTHPTIENNVFRGCHVGILHQRSHSRIAGNDMKDDAFPPGTGITVEDTRSPVIEDNVIADYGTGVLVRNARAFVRNNTIVGNVGDGVRVESNTGPMDVQGNAIRGNGGHGVRLVGVADVSVSRNVVEVNGGDGIRVEGASAGVVLDGNAVRGNRGDGVLLASPGVAMTGGDVRENARNGVVLRDAPGIRVSDVEVLRNGANGVLIERAQAAIARVNASENNESGFRYDPKGPLSPLGSTDLTRVRAMRNGLAGLHNVVGNATFATDAWFEGNRHAGLDNDDLASLIDVRNGYWGDPGGPTHATNPLGRGDRIEGGALYHPFRTAPP